ncbi:MAG: GDP-mannose 4,6-dehydratase [Deltaproteobacteria bacterium]
MKVLITGCFGFVGRYLVEALADAEVIAVDRQARPPGFPEVAHAYELDLLDLGAFENVIARHRPDRLVHLASFSSVGFSWHEPIASFTNNTNIFLNVLECVRRQSPATRILSIGSSEEYGLVTEADLPLRETSPLRPLSPYAVARVAQEHLGEVYVRGYGLDVVATRSFNHLGPGQSAQFVISGLAKQVAELARGERDRIKVGTTSVIRDFLDVRDVVAAYLALLDRGARGEVFNICSGHGTSIADALAMLGRIANVEPVLEIDPALVRPIENTIVVGDHAKLTAAVGWVPTISLEQSLRDVCSYWEARR